MNLPQIIKDQLTQVLNTKDKMTLMEVCGTHTMNIAKFGVRSVLPSNIRIISGPGCPVCVTSSKDIYKAIELAKREDVMVASFGDMLKVPCLNDSLMNYKNVKIIYSPIDALKLAKDNPDKKVVLLGVGFETTTPTIASAIVSAEKNGIDNFSVLCMHKVVPPAIDAIIKNKESRIDGFILPGHVAVVTGSAYFDFIAANGGRGVVTGFDPINILDSICKLIMMISREENNIVNNYNGVVSDGGNKKAQSIMREVFDICDSDWRGIGIIRGSGLRILDKYSRFDAGQIFEIENKEVEDPKGCICGQVLMGAKMPTDCKLYSVKCTPSDPVGPCMVSSEGTCAAYYKYIQDK